jgi:hypothetical protein
VGLVSLDLRYASTYIVGAVCPRDGKGAALVLLFRNTGAMNLYLAGIGAMVIRICSIAIEQYDYRALRLSSLCFGANGRWRDAGRRAAPLRLNPGGVGW